MAKPNLRNITGSLTVLFGVANLLLLYFAKSPNDHRAVHLTVSFLSMVAWFSYLAVQLLVARKKVLSPDN